MSKWKINFHWTRDRSMKKHKILTFIFSSISVFGFVTGFFEANDGRYDFVWPSLFENWLVFSLPLIVLFIWTKIFD